MRATSEFQLKAADAAMFATANQSVGGFDVRCSPSRMEPQGCERHRWVKPRGRNERERVKSIRPSADLMFDKANKAA